MPAPSPRSVCGPACCAPHHQRRAPPSAMNRQTPSPCPIQRGLVLGSRMPRAWAPGLQMTPVPGLVPAGGGEAAEVRGRRGSGSGGSRWGRGEFRFWEVSGRKDI